MVHSMGLCVLVLVLFGIERGFCIQCYSCSSKITQDCIAPNKNQIQLRKCGLTELNTTKVYAEQLDSSFSKYFQVDIHSQEPQVSMNCLKQETKVGNQKYVIRGCQLAASDNLDICVKVKEISKDHIHTSYCTLCNGDGCNPAPLAVASIPLLALVYSAHMYC